MNELLQRLAREAGFDVRDGYIMPNDVDIAAEMERFAALVAQELANAIDSAAFSQDATQHEVRDLCAHAARLAFPMPPADPPAPPAEQWPADAKPADKPLVFNRIRSSFGVNNSIDTPAEAEEKNRRMRALLDDVAAIYRYHGLG